MRAVLSAAGAGLLAMSTILGCGAPGEEAGARIVVERSERPGHWRATYLFDEPVDGLRFQRPAAFYRESVWSIRTPGWSLARDGEEQTLVASPGAAAARIEVEFPEYTDVLAKEYEFFLTFTDGSVGMYTGHLYATPADGDETVRRLELVPDAGDRVVVQGEVRDGATVWDDPHGDGTYVYFGRLAPLETPEMVAIVDSGAPRWLVDDMNALLPEMFATYTERFGEPLPWKPVVIFNFDDVEMEGLSSGGGTLTGLVQMSAVGSAWREATPENAEQLLYLVAHEAAHLWNGQLHNYEDPDDSWMHEGSADAFADLALLGSGHIDADRLAARRTEALNHCASGLGAGPLTESAARRQYRNYYTCGSLVAIWSTAAIGAGPGDTSRLYDLWRTIFEKSDPASGNYGRDTYLAALAELGADADAIESLRGFLDAEHADPAAALVALMSGVGIELEQLDRPLPALRRDRAAAALRHLMAATCVGRIGFYTEGRRFRTEPIDACDPFSRELRVVAIEGHELSPAGDLAFEATAERCREGSAVTLGLDDGTSVRVPCTTPPAPGPAPLAFPVLRD